MTEATETTEAPQQLRRVNAMVRPEGLASIERAIVLKLATLACTEGDSRELAGEALTAICREWNAGKVAEYAAMRKA